MVALLHPEHVPAAGREPIERPRLRLVDQNGPAGCGHGQSAGETGAPRTRPLTGLVVLLGLVVLMLIVVLRVAQGTPPAASWEGLALSAYEAGNAEAGNATAATDAMAPGDRVHVVQAGDTLWALAVELDPAADPRPVVDALADRNGGPVLQIGQRLVIPAELLAD